MYLKPSCFCILVIAIFSILYAKSPLTTQNINAYVGNKQCKNREDKISGCIQTDTIKQLHSQIPYQYGRMNGDGKVYYQDNKIYITMSLKDDVMIAWKAYYPNNKLLGELKFDSNKAGIITFYYEDNTIALQYYRDNNLALCKNNKTLNNNEKTMLQQKLTYGEITNDFLHTLCNASLTTIQ